MNEIDQVFSAEAIAQRVVALGAEIRADAGNAEVFLLSILKGTSCFLADLLRATPGKCTFGFVDAISQPADPDTPSVLHLDYLSFANITGRNVYVLKDVVSTGIIETWLLSQLRLRNPATLKLVALLDMTEQRTIDLTSDFIAFEVVEYGAYVGYGLERQNHYGNLPYIGLSR